MNIKILLACLASLSFLTGSVAFAGEYPPCPTCFHEEKLVNEVKGICCFCEPLIGNDNGLLENLRKLEPAVRYIEMTKLYRQADTEKSVYSLIELLTGTSQGLKKSHTDQLEAEFEEKYGSYTAVPPKANEIIVQ